MFFGYVKECLSENTEIFNVLSNSISYSCKKRVYNKYIYTARLSATSLFFSNSTAQEGAPFFSPNTISFVSLTSFLHRQHIPFFMEEIRFVKDKNYEGIDKQSMQAELEGLQSLREGKHDMRFTRASP